MLDNPHILAGGGYPRRLAAIVLFTISTNPHVTVGGLWEKPDNDPGWQSPILAVEQRIRDLAKLYKVNAVVMDPFRWARTAAQLRSEGFTVIDWPFAPARVTKATVALHDCIVNAKLSHSNDPDLTRDVLNTSVVEDRGGIRISKPSAKRRERRKIDLCAAMLVAVSHALFLASQPKKRKRGVSHG